MPLWAKIISFAAVALMALQGVIWAVQYPLAMAMTFAVFGIIAGLIWLMKREI